MANIRFIATLDTIPLDKGIRKATASVQQFGNRMKGLFGDIEQQSYRAMTRLTAYMSIFAAAGLVKQIVEVRGQFQQLQIAFETMLDSKEKADRIMQESIAFAQKTPFTLMDVTTNAKQLMAMGVSFEKVMETMKSLGDVAAGLSVPLQRLVINYGQVLTLGRLQQREVRDFAMAGVPLIAELAKNMGKTKEEIQNLINAGKIGFPEVEAAFKSMSSEGGKFYNLMEKQNKSVTGQISNLVDKWQVAMNEIGKSNEGLIYSSINMAATIVKNFEEIGRVIKDLVIAYGAYKGALMAVAALHSVHKGIETGITASQYAPLLSAKQAQIIADKGLIAGSAAYNREVVATITAQKLQAIAHAEATAAKVAETQATLASTRAEIADMVSGKTAMNVKRLKALRTLDAKLSVDLETLSIKANTAAQARNNIVDKVDIANKKTQITLTGILTTAQKGLAAAMKQVSVWAAANVWTLVAAGLAAIAFGTYKLITADSALEKAEKKLQKSLEKTNEERDKIIGKSNDLIGIIRNETNFIYEQARAYDELIKSSNLWSEYSFTELKNMSEEQIKNLREQDRAQTDLNLATSNYDKQLKIVLDLRKKIKDEEEMGTAASLRKAFVLRDRLKGEIIILERYKEILGEIKDALSFAQFMGQTPEYRKQTLEASRDFYLSELEKAGAYSDRANVDEDYIGRLKKSLAETEELLKEFYVPAEQMNYDYWEKIKKNAELNKRALLPSQKGTPEWNTYVQQIAEAERMMAVYEDSKEKSNDRVDKLAEQRRRNELLLEELLAEELIKTEDDSLQKRLDLAKAAYQKRLRVIEEGRLATLKQTGKSELEGDDLSTYTASKVRAEQIYVNKTIALRKEAAAELKKIQGEVSEAFMSDLEKEEKAIRDKYDKWIKEAYANGADQNYIINLIASQINELNNASSESAFKISDYYAKMFGDISEYGIETLNFLIEKTKQIQKDAVPKNIGGETFMVWDEESIDEQGNKIKEHRSLTIEAFNSLIEKMTELKKKAMELNPIKAVADAFKELSEALNAKNTEGIGNAVKKVNEALASSKQYVEDLIYSFEGLGEAPKQFLNAALGISTGIIGMMEGIKKISAATFASLSMIDKASVVLAAISAAVQVLSAIINPIIKGLKAFREAEAKFLKENIKLQREYNIALNEQMMQYKNSSVFINDYAKSIYNASIALIDAQKNYNSVYNTLDKLYVQTGVRKKFLGKENIYSHILEAYPYLVDKATGRIDISIANSILGMENLAKSTRKALEDLIAWQEQIDKANDQIDSAIDSIAGFLSSDLFNALRTAFDDGTDSFLAFKDSVSKGLKEIVSQMVFNEIFSQSFKDLQDRLEESFGIGGDQDITDDIAILLNSAPQLIAAWDKAMKDAESAAKAARLDWGKTSSSGGGLAGQIRRELTEDTGTELAAIFRSTRDDGRKALSQGRTQIGHLINIEKNTQETVYRLDRAILELIDINKNTKGAYAGAL